MLRLVLKRLGSRHEGLRMGEGRPMPVAWALPHPCPCTPLWLHMRTWSMSMGGLAGITS